MDLYSAVNAFVGFTYFSYAYYTVCLTGTSFHAVYTHDKHIVLCCSVMLVK